MLNKLFPPRDNKAVIDFTFGGDFETGGLNNFTEITLEIGSETYSTISESSELYIIGDVSLVLDIGNSTSLEEGVYFPSIIGYSQRYDDGYILTSSCDNRLSQPIIVCR
jgi:hypothetical protein